MTIRLGGGLRRVTACATMVMSAPAMAAAQSGEMDFQIPAGSLDYALTLVAKQSGHDIAFDPALVRGRTVGAITGSMTPEVAVRRLLSSTGLELRIDGQGRWMVVRGMVVTVPTEGKMLGTVRVTAGAERLANVGANGSSDPLATEGTKSYTTRAQAISSKQPLTLKETPQAVSVLTRQQLDDRTINSFGNALDAIPGVTVSGGQTTTVPTAIYSRGFEVTNVQIDGGSPLSIGTTTNFTSNRSVVDDLSAYDSVELQRGAAGQFTGVGNPGGVLSLVRKRPLDHAALTVIAQGGSWDRFRGVVDASSPVMLNGLLRARVVLTGERNDEFYDFATRRFGQAYVNVEIDPSPTTTINVGAKLTRERSTPFNGLPTDKNGALIDFPRSTCYCTDWSRNIVDGKEFFGQLTQKIGKDWTVHLNASAELQKTRAFLLTYYINSGAGIDPANPLSAGANAYDAHRKSDQYLVDGYIAGKATVFGMGLDLTLGANYQYVDQKVRGVENFFYYDTSSGGLFPFTPSAFPRPSAGSLEPGFINYPFNSQRQYGVYATARLSPVDWVHLTIGERYSRYAVRTVIGFDFGEDSFSVNNITRYGVLAPPNIGLVVDISKTLSAFANYANIFDRANNLTKEGELVKPTTGLNAEAGLKKELAGGMLNLSGSVFYIKQVNLPQRDLSVPFNENPASGSQCCYVTDGSRFLSKGVDLQVQGALTPRLNADLSYVFNDFEYKPGTTGQIVAQARAQPKHLAKLWGSWRPPVAGDRLMLGAGLHAETRVTYTLRVPVSGSDPLSFVTRRGGYVTADGMVKFTLDPRFALQLNVNNILDRKYYRSIQTQLGNYYGTPRSFLLTLQGSL